ncbi:amidohydrolase family protein [Cupriavidus necator]|uniref:amidohydrolase family protein n=1 Tax=Cupriavidus necator TaxID=106590 RepID=UPI001D023183|nr:amidohydrolase family protein [Cupriavidus necator]
MTKRLIFKGGHVLSMDPGIGEFEQGDVLVEGGRIAAVGPSIDALDAEVIDVSDGIVLPGFVDAHRHTWQSALRHRLGEISFSGYGCVMLRGFAPHYSPDDVHIGTLLGCVSALEAGTTTLLDWSHALNTPEHADAAVDALRASGIRAVFAQGWPRGDGQNWTTASTLGHPSDIERVRRELLFSDDALVTHAMAARGPEMTTEVIVQHDFALARQLGLRISMHAGTGEFGPKYRAIEKMAKLGLLGPDLTLIHLCTSSEAELRMVADHGVHACIGPQAEMMLDGAGVMALGRLMALGIEPCLSGDTETCGSGDLLTQMRIALAAQRMLASNNLEPIETPSLTPRQLLELATIAGARACGLSERTGSLTPGKDADLIVIRRSDLNLVPVSDPAGAIVLAAHPGNIDTVVVKGEFKKRYGELVGYDIPSIKRRAFNSRERLLALSNGK